MVNSRMACPHGLKVRESAPEVGEINICCPEPNIIVGSERDRAVALTSKVSADAKSAFF